MEFLGVILLFVISAVVSSAVKAGQSGKTRSANRSYYSGLAEKMLRQAQQIGGQRTEVNQPLYGAPLDGRRIQASAYQPEGSGSEGTGSEGTSSEGKQGQEGFGGLINRPAMEPRLYAAKPVDAPAMAENAPFFAGREGTQIYSTNPAMTVYRRKPTAHRALAIGNSLSSAEGMAQAVVMAEVLTHRGGRRGTSWKN